MRLNITDIKFLAEKVKDFISPLGWRERAGLFLFASLIVIVTVLAFISASQSREVSTLRAKAGDFGSLLTEYQYLKVNLDFFEGRGSLVKSRGILEEAHGIFNELGLKKKLKTTKGLGAKEIKDSYSEEAVEITAENLSMNEVVNILYKIEKAPLMLSVKSLSLKKSFDNPDSLNMQLSLSLFTKK